MSKDADRPPILRTWNNLYLLVVVVLVAEIILFLAISYG